MLCLAKVHDVCLGFRGGALGELFVLLLIKEEGAIYQTLVWDPPNTAILMRLVTAAGFVTLKEILVNHKAGKE